MLEPSTVKLATLPLVLVALLCNIGSARADDEDTTTQAKPRPEAAGTHLDFTLGSSSRLGQVGPSGGFRAGYGFSRGPVIIGPQLSLDLAVGQNVGAIGVVPGMRIEVPIEHFGPYLEGGIGLGYATGNADSMTPMCEFGGGFLYHVGSHFAAGLEALYMAGFAGKGDGKNFDGGWRYGPLVAAIF